MTRRVLFILPDLGGGGAEAVTLTLLSVLDRTRFEAVLYVLKDQGPLRERLPAGVGYYAASAPGQRIRENFRTVWRDLREVLATTDLLVGCLELDATYAAWLLGALAHKPVVGWVHTPLQDYLKRVPAWHSRAVRLVYPRLARVIAPSVSVKQSLMQVAAVDANQALVFPNPLDLRWVYRQAEQDMPAALQPMWSRPMIVGMGRLEPEKNYQVLIRAFAQARRENLNANLVILGDGPERGKLQSLAETERVSDAVYLPGFISNPYPLLKRAVVFVHPSRVEGFGMALVEAMSLGVPVVAGQSSAGPQELLDHGKFGWLIPMDDPALLRKFLVSLVMEPDRLSAFRQVGPVRAADYAAERVACHWHELFESLA